MKLDLVSRELIKCTPENKTELVDLLNILGIEAMLSAEEVNPAYFAALKGDVLEFRVQAHASSLEGGGGFWRNTITTEYLSPYWDQVVKRYGYCFPFDIDLTPAMHIATHTHFVERLWVAAGKTYFTSVFEHFNWMGKVFKDLEEAEAKAQVDSHHHLANILGSYRYVPEFIEVGRGLFKHNPAWGHGRPVYDPGVCNERVWVLMSETWLERFGTPEQKAVLARYSFYDKRPRSWACVRDHQGFYVDNYTKHVTWEEFKALGK